MSVNEPSSAEKKPWFSLGAKLLIFAVVLGFVVLHVIGDAAFRGPALAAHATAVGAQHYGD
jgi:hypothetical protein